VSTISANSLRNNLIGEINFNIKSITIEENLMRPFLLYQIM